MSSKLTPVTARTSVAANCPHLWPLSHPPLAPLPPGEGNPTTIILSRRKMMGAQPQPHFTVAEYLAQENESTFKHEYFQGRVYAMSGASPAHSVISTNLAALFVAQLRGSSCTTFSNDTRITVPSNGLYTYPDLSIVCGKPIFDEQGKTPTHWSIRPSLLKSSPIPPRLMIGDQSSNSTGDCPPLRSTS